MECGMERRFHRGFTAAERTELWDRWKRGESLKAIGRAFGKPSSSIYFLVAPHGGIRPAQRRRSRLALTLAEREVISRGVTAHHSARSIAKLLGRSPSTVSREHPQRKVLAHEPRIGSMVLAVLPLQSFSILASIGREGDSIFYDALLILPTLVFQSFDRPLSADQIRVNHQSQDR